VTPDLARMRRDRHARLLDAMRATDIETLLLLGQSNVGYATGARLPAMDQGRALHRRPIAVVTDDGAPPQVWTWVPDGVPLDLPEASVHSGIDVEWSEGADALVAALPSGPLAVDELSMPLRAALAAAGRDVGDASAALSMAKVIKTSDEIACISHAQAINEAAIAHVAETLRPGASGAELTASFLGAIFGLGASGNTVDPVWQVMPRSIADGPYSATGDVVFPTGSTTAPLEADDVVWVDNGLSYEGYQSDYGHTWVVGRDPDARERAQCARWRDIVASVLEATKPGATARDLTRAAGEVNGRRPWLSHLYLAHGTGTDSAEMPFIGTDLGDEFDESVALATGMVLVLEPVVWEDGHGGFRAEQIVTVTNDGYESLSNLTWDAWE